MTSWSLAALAIGPAASAWAVAASVSARIAALRRASSRSATAISSSALMRACSASRRAIDSAIAASFSARAASGRPRFLRWSPSVWMSCSWNVSSTRPWLVSDVSASSATSRAKAARSLTISSTDSRPTIERSDPARTSWVNVLDVVLLAEEALGGGADRVLGAADLDDGDALQRALDALGGHGRADRHRDLAGREVDRGQLLDHRQHEHAGPHDDLLAGEVGADGAGLGIGHRLALAPGDDERLVRPGDLDPRHDDADDEQDEDGRAGSVRRRWAPWLPFDVVVVW